MKYHQHTFEYTDATLEEIQARGIIPIYLNASSLKLSACDRRYAFAVAGGLRAGGTEDPILTMGSALHKFAETYTRTKGDVTDAITEARRAFPAITAAELIPIVARRAEVRIPEPLYLDGQPCVEVKFAAPWMIFTYDEITYCFVVCGTIDHLGLDNNALMIIDYKSTRYAVIEYAINKYKHETQFKFYLWALWKFGARFLPLEIHNMLVESRAYSQVCFIQLSGKSPRWIMDTSRRNMTPFMYAEYETELRGKLNQLANAFLIHTHGGANDAQGMISNGCQYCDYTTYCHAPTEAARVAANLTFTHKPYNPIEERGEPV